MTITCYSWTIGVIKSTFRKVAPFLIDTQHADFGLEELGISYTVLPALATKAVGDNYVNDIVTFGI